MLANEHRGEVAAEINGRTVTFCVTTGALAQLATFFGTSVNREVMARILGPVVGQDESGVPQFQGPSFSDIPAIVSAFANGAIPLDEAQRLSPRDAGPLLEAVAHAVALALSGPDDAKKNDAVTAATVASR